MKTCATCRWMVEPGEFAKCEAPKNRVRAASSDPTGFGRDREAEWRWSSCSIQRTGGLLDMILARICGRDGWWWEPRSDQKGAQG